MELSRGALRTCLRLSAAPALGALFVLATQGLCATPGDSPPRLVAPPSAGDFPLVAAGRAAPIYVDSADVPAVARAAGDLAADIRRVTGVRPGVDTGTLPGAGPVVVIGEFGHSPLIDRLVSAGLLDPAGIAGQWESHVIQVMGLPGKGGRRALIIAGSDRRGTIYGIYDISQAIGISPWYWWADVPAHRRSELWIAAGVHRQGPPAVKYRGIFLNDEDWGLRPWASRTFDPATDNIGPKTYARIFELLLRLRGNLLWPAMHPGTRAFNFYRDDKALADAYGIVMGSSHAEPMLRDNVDEWAREGHGEYNYVTNRRGVLAYWEQRVHENARYENIYTVGMRGIHDDPMNGGGSQAQKADRLRQIIVDQRDLLRRWVNRDVSRVPQMFCPYKEVLPIYELMPGIVPDDVTLMWPDDNYGYVQHYSNPIESRRAGGAGVYYHVSYWGRPYDYLWLCSTAPAQIAEELTKVWDCGARRIWVLNVGDLKPAEIDLEFFLRLAWNPRGWIPESGQDDFLRDIAKRDFGAGAATEIASILDSYYLLNFQRRPEHMGIDPGVPLLAPPPSAASRFTAVEARSRMAAFASLAKRADSLAQHIAPARRDSYFELVQYPVDAAALMNQKGLNLDAYYAAGPGDRSEAAAYLKEAATAQAGIDAATSYYNNRVANGKWRCIMSDAPRNLAVFRLPPEARPASNSEWRDDPPGLRWSPLRLAPVKGPNRASAEAGGSIIVVAADMSDHTATSTGTWHTIEGLGYMGRAIEVLPSTMKPVSGTAAIRAEAPCLRYEVNLPSAGNWLLTLRRLPTWPIVPGGIRYAVAFDDGRPEIVACTPYRDEDDARWQQDVLRNASYSVTWHELSAGRHTLSIWALNPGLVLDALRLSLGGGRGSYAWPAVPAGVN